jgi:RimJ/RimL family protein N-acetyltransferase
VIAGAQGSKEVRSSGVNAGSPAHSRPVVPPFEDKLAANGIVLRTPTHEDVPTLAAAFADPVLGGEAGLPPLGEEQLHAMFEEQLPQWRATGQLVPYAILDGDTSELLGGATLRQLDATRHTIEIGYWLFAHARGRGVATRAVGALVDWLFANGVGRVEAVVRIGNTPSERVLERCGFVREGIKRRYLLHKGACVDATLFSRLKDDERQAGLSMLLVQTVRMPDEGIEAFQRFEAAVLPLLPKYEARLERRLRSLDGSVEIHVVSFSSREALESYRADPERQKHLPLLHESDATLELLEVTDLTEEMAHERTA